MTIIHSQQYLEALKDTMLNTPEEIIVVCQAWNGGTFGSPGYGSVSWVQSEIARARVAIEAYKNYLYY
jgi:hypothetical protein